MPAPEIGTTDNDYTVTQKEAADFLQVSTKSISRYRKRGLPYKLILNPVAGKQEVRFCYTDLARWHEGRQLLATYARDAADSVDSKDRIDHATHDPPFLADLLAAYKEQIHLLRDQLEDMREQLGRRDRQIDDLMRLMVGLQLEYKPNAVAPKGTSAAIVQEAQRIPDLPRQRPFEQLYETIPLPEYFQQAQTFAASPPAPPTQNADSGKKSYSRAQLSASILRLRRKGKSYTEIAGALNRIGAAPLSGQQQWTVLEVKTLLPALLDMAAERLNNESAF